MNDDLYELEILSSVYNSKIYYPNSKGLCSLESYLYGSTSISSESFISKIKEKCNSSINKILAKLNRIVTMFTALTNEQKQILKNLEQGKGSVDDTKVLPISRGAVNSFLKFVAMVLSWFALTSLMSYTSKAMKQQSLGEKRSMEEKRRFNEEADKYEELLKNHKERLSTRELVQAKCGIFGSLTKSAGQLRDKIKNVDWDKIEQVAENARKNADSIKAPSDKIHKMRNVLRSTILTGIIIGWFTLSVRIISKVVDMFKRIASSLGVSHKKQEDEFDVF